MWKPCRWAELGQVAERERADSGRHLAIGERQRREFAEEEVGVGKLGRGAIQHRLALDAEKVVALLESFCHRPTRRDQLGAAGASRLP